MKIWIFFNKASTSSVNHSFIQFKGDRQIFAQVLAPWATYILLRKLQTLLNAYSLTYQIILTKNIYQALFLFKISIINIRYNAATWKQWSKLLAKHISKLPTSERIIKKRKKKTCRWFLRVGFVHRLHWLIY